MSVSPLKYPPYFLVAVSTKENLTLCRRYALAGLTSTQNGAWAYSDVPIGSRISFLYGAQAHDLFIVKEKFCAKDWNSAPPWPPITFRSKYTYGFPFRLLLERIREFDYPLTSDKFAYVGENLMLRGGYRKSHFQADSTDLGHASEIGVPPDTSSELLQHSSPHFQLRFCKKKELIAKPEIFQVREIILQAAIRNYLSDESRLESFLGLVGITSVKSSQMEALGEKALPQGYVDILLKEAHPTGSSKKIPIEVKSNKASALNFKQLGSYMEEIGKDCIGGVLIARDFMASSPKIPELKCVSYELDGLSDIFTFDEIVSSLKFKFHGN